MSLLLNVFKTTGYRLGIYLAVLLMAFIVTSEVAEAAVNAPKPVYHNEGESEKPQYSRFPIPLSTYQQEEKELEIEGVWDKIMFRAEKDQFNVMVTLVFLGAIIHTFLIGRFQKISHSLAERHKRKLKQSGFRVMYPEEQMPVSFLSTLFHFFGEVEAVFGLWIIPFLFVCHKYYSFEDFKFYLNYDCSFVEPLFVMIVMIIASSRPIFRLAESTLKLGARLGQSTPAAWWVSVLTLAPLLGSLITEPAAMTIGAMILSKKFYSLKPSKPLMYATLGLLFVNISIGGTLSSFAAPPVVMVAEKWNWGMSHMILNFGWKAVAAIIISNITYYIIFRKEFKRLSDVYKNELEFDEGMPTSWEDRLDNIPAWVTLTHVLFLGWTVFFAHVPVLFIGSFLFFMGFTVATPQYQNSLTIRTPMMVAFFLAGLVILGGVQGWWLEPVLIGMKSEMVLAGATLLTAFNDNAAVTFLASTVPNLTESVKYAVVAGAVAGGGLTVIANAPNPAGLSILGKHFRGISPLWLFLFALMPTAVVFVLFSML